jgi:hypothetical protein
LAGHVDSNTTVSYDRRDERAKQHAVNKLHMSWQRRYHDFSECPESLVGPGNPLSIVIKVKGSFDFYKIPRSRVRLALLHFSVLSSTYGRREARLQLW